MRKAKEDQVKKECIIVTSKIENRSFPIDSDIIIQINKLNEKIKAEFYQLSRILDVLENNIEQIEKEIKGIHSIKNIKLEKQKIFDKKFKELENRYYAIC